MRWISAFDGDPAMTLTHEQMNQALEKMVKTYKESAEFAHKIGDGKLD